MYLNWAQKSRIHCHASTDLDDEGRLGRRDYEVG